LTVRIERDAYTLHPDPACSERANPQFVRETNEAKKWYWRIVR
jgi:hypothetical protein